MRAPKDRLYRVLVIGATPAGISACNKLGEMGVPVTLVDTDSDLDAKLSARQWELASGLTLNHALRPGLVRILRNPRIRCLLPATVNRIKHSPQGFSVRIKVEPTFVDPDRCVLCGRCAEVCPVTFDDGSKAVRFNGRQSLPGRVVIDKRRRPLCQESCPLGVNAQGYVALARKGRYAEALELIRRNNVLPGICGRICHHPCESSCRRNELDEPVAIRDIKRFLADYEASNGGSGERSGADGKSSPQETRTAGKTEVLRSTRIAVIGSGPAGLAAAADLARIGYCVTVFEKEDQVGGLLRYGIGPYRLPRSVIDRDVSYIESFGVRFETAHPIDLATDLGELQKQFSAVIVTTGSWSDRRLGVPGEGLEGVGGCIDFLSRCYQGLSAEQVGSLDGPIAVIGDGNSAYDLARSLIRLGAEATIVSWFSEQSIPADADEVRAAADEGVRLVDRTQVIEFVGANGKLEALRCVPTQPGEPDVNGIAWPVPVPGAEPFELSFQRALIAIGQGGAPDAGSSTDPIKRSRGGFFETDAGGRTDLAGVYAAGDAVTGPTSVVQAMASGREIAASVHFDLSGEVVPGLETARPGDRDFEPIPAHIPSMARLLMPERQPAACAQSFSEVSLGYSEPQVLEEAARCLQCGVCSECLECVEVCQATRSISHDQKEEEITEQAGVVIVADQRACPPIKGEDVLRAYGPKVTRVDVYAMMLRGFAAAAEAMILLGRTPEGLKGRGLSFSPPDPQLSAENRLGVFVCRCNDALGWNADLSQHLQILSEVPDVVVSEAIGSACSPEGISHLLRTIREQSLTRVVLASCVCCPLDFVCSACTDQRSRLKDALFTGTGVSRSMVETCNMRGEVLRLLRGDPKTAYDRFVGLLDRSINRARFLQPLGAPARPYNFTTAVIGDSEAAIKSAMTLAQAGLEVLLLGSSNKPLSKTVDHPNIHCLDGSTVKGIEGTLGNFRVAVEMDGYVQMRDAGAVILGEQSRKRIPYVPLPELPPRMMEYTMQKQGVPGVPFLQPGATSIPGLFLANPPAVKVSGRVKGAAAAIMAASVMPRRPRQNKGYTVVVEPSQCRGCGRCHRVCPYQAVSYRQNGHGGWHAVVDEALCKGCGNCISVCPSKAVDSPYRDRRYLEQMLEELLI